MSLEEIQSVVKKVKKNLFRKFNDRSFGILKSHMRGQGMEFKEHKQYAHGDDLRFIDWKILARTMNPYVKVFEQERNMEILVVLDASLSMLLGYKGISKLQAAIDVTLFLYLFSQRTQYKVHTLVFGEEIHDIPKSNGEKGLVAFIARMRAVGIIDEEGRTRKSYRPSSSPNEQERLEYLRKIGLRRKEVVLLSDFFQFLPQMQIKELLNMKNVHGIRIVSPLDEAVNFPYRVFGRRADKGQGKADGRIFKGKDDSPVPGKLNRLSVESSYLEDFVREIME